MKRFLASVFPSNTLFQNLRVKSLTIWAHKTTMEKTADEEVTKLIVKASGEIFVAFETSKEVAVFRGLQHRKHCCKNA